MILSDISLELITLGSMWIKTENIPARVVEQLKLKKLK